MQVRFSSVRMSVSYWPGVTGLSGVAELALLLALLEVGVAAFRVPAFFLKTLIGKNNFRKKKEKTSP